MSHKDSGFVFINNTSTVDSKSKPRRKLVRAHAARQQRSTNDTDTHAPIKSAAKWNKYQARTRIRRKANLNTFSLDLSVLEQSESQDNTLSAKSVSPGRKSKHLAPQAGNGPLVKYESVSSDENVPNLTPGMPGAGWVAPFVPLENLRKPYFKLLVEHYLTNLATDIPELDAGQPFILRTKWFPMVITSSATLNIVLLTSASHYAVYHSLFHDRQIQEILLSLKYQTLNSTNKLIRQSGTHALHCDAVIGAVAKMASYEAMFGLPELYHTHMRGLKNMVSARGGLESLGLDGLLARMVLWIDINSAFLLNSTAYFLPTVPLAGHVVLRHPNPSGFLGAS